MLPYAAFTVLLCLVVTAANATVCPKLNSAANFSVIADTTITNAGNTTIQLSLGLSPGTAITGFPPGVVHGSKDIDNSISATAKADATSAYMTCVGATNATVLTGEDLGNRTLVPGVYKFATTAALTLGTLTLKGSGTYIFQIGTALTTGPSTKVVLTSGAQACRVFWQVGSSAVFGANSQFQGNTLAHTSVTVNSKVVYTGSIYALGAAITLSDDAINGPGTCTAC